MEDEHRYSGDLRWHKRKARNLAYKALRQDRDRREAARKGANEQAARQPSAAGVTGIVSATGSAYRVRIGDEPELTCRVAKSALSDEIESLVVGDRVVVEREEDRCTIVEVLPRRSQLVRMRTERSRRSPQAHRAHVLAANVDLSIIVAAAAAPPFHPRLIDRYLVLCRYGGVDPVVCINKCDLVSELPDLSAFTSIGVPIVYTSVVAGAGIDELRSMIAGKCSVLTGQSGVGKSSLLNALVGQEVQRVGEVRTYDGKGRHTTTGSSLHALGGETYVIDTPGIRSLGLWRIDPDELQYYFPEFEPFAARCRFRDCRHAAEPNCAVRAAAEIGELPAYRYDSYLRLLAEESGG